MPRKKIPIKAVLPKLLAGDAVARIFSQIPQVYAVCRAETKSGLPLMQKAALLPVQKRCLLTF